MDDKEEITYKMRSLDIFLKFFLSKRISDYSERKEIK